MTFTDEMLDIILVQGAVDEAITLGLIGGNRRLAPIGFKKYESIRDTRVIDGEKIAECLGALGIILDNGTEENAVLIVQAILDGRALEYINAQ